MESQYIGDICKVKSGIVCHQVNCQKKMGKGLALQIRNKFTKHYIDFINTEPELGKALITEISPNLYVAALYSQYHFGPKGKTYTNYGAFEKCLSELNAFATVQKLTVFLPYKIGVRSIRSSRKTSRIMQLSILQPIWSKPFRIYTKCIL